MVSEQAGLRSMGVIGGANLLSRFRGLESQEVDQVERALRVVARARKGWRWTEREDRLLKAFIRRRARNGRPKPFQPNDEVRRLAAELNRSYMAVHRRIERLRKGLKCSDAKRKAKG